MEKIILLITGILVGILSLQNTYANVTVKNQKIEKKTTMKVIGNKVIIEGDIKFKSYTRIPYDIQVNGNIIFGDSVKILGNITATGDIQAGNQLVIYKTLSGKSIVTGNRLVANKLVATGNIILNGKATVTGGIISGADVEVGSDFVLYGNSQIEGDMKMEIDSQIYGTLYIYGNIRSKERFNFSGGKLKVYGNFRTLKETEVEGRIYIYGTAGRRSYYTNKIRYNFLLKNKKYKGFMKKIDPVLSYSLGEKQVKYILEKIQIQEYKISEQRKKININYYKFSQNKLSQEIELYQEMEANLIIFINNYISMHPRDKQEWDIIKFEREKETKTFIYKYL